MHPFVNDVGLYFVANRRQPKVYVYSRFPSGTCQGKGRKNELKNDADDAIVQRYEMSAYY